MKIQKIEIPKMEYQRIDALLSLIQVPKARRRPNPEKEPGLMESIEQVGLLYPIILGWI